MSAIEPTAPAKKLPPVVRATGFVSFFTDMGSEIIYPILPLFLAQLGASRAMIGAIEGLAEGLPAFIKFFSGTLADRVRNRKWLVLTGYALSTLFKPLIALAHTSVFVLVIRLLDRVGKGIRTAPRDALVADFSDKSMRGYAFGYQRAMDHAGAMLGGLIGFALLYWLGSSMGSMRQAIAWSFIPGILSVLTIVFFVHDRPDRMTVHRAVPNPVKGLRTLPPAYFLYIGAASVFALANSSDAFLLLRASDMGVSVPYIPLIWAFLHLIKSATSLWGGKLSDRVGRYPVLLCGWTLYAFVYAGFALYSSAAAVWILFAAYGLFYGLTEGASRAVIADLIPEGMRGTAFGFWGMMEGLLLVAASILTGWLWDATGGSRVPFLFCGGMSLLAAILLVVWRISTRRPSGATGC